MENAPEKLWSRWLFCCLKREEFYFMNQYYAIASSSRLNVVAARWPRVQKGLKSFWNRNFTKKCLHFLDPWEGGGVKNWSKLLTDSTKKLPTWGRGVSKIRKNSRHCLWNVPKDCYRVFISFENIISCNVFPICHDQKTFKLWTCLRYTNFAQLRPKTHTHHCPKLSTTPITAMERWPCLPLLFT